MLDFLTDPATGRLSESKLWVSVAKAAMVWAFIYNVYKDTDTEWLWFVFAAILTAHESFSRLISWKYSGKDESVK